MLYLDCTVRNISYYIYYIYTYIIQTVRYTKISLVVKKYKKSKKKPVDIDLFHHHSLSAFTPHIAEHVTAAQVFVMYLL